MRQFTVYPKSTITAAEDAEWAKFKQKYQSELDSNGGLDWKASTWKQMLQMLDEVCEAFKIDLNWSEAKQGMMGIFDKNNDEIAVISPNELQDSVTVELEDSVSSKDFKKKLKVLVSELLKDAKKSQKVDKKAR